MTNNTHTDRQHAKLAPSSAARWMACPGSVLLSSKVHKPETTVYAAEGTEAHEWAEKALMAPVPSAVISDISNSEMKSYVEGYVGYVLKLKKKLKPFLFHVEAKTELNKHIYGIGDVGMMYHVGNGEVAGVITDFKYGAGHSVAVKDNLQTLCYALGYQKKASKGIKFKHCTVIIYQPRIEGEKAVRLHRYTADELMKWQRKIVSAGNIALKMLAGEKKPKFQAGEHCLFCPAKGVCTELLNHTKANALIEIDNGRKLPDPTMLTDDQLVAILQYRKIIENFMAGAVEYACKRSQQGNPVPGTKLVEGRAQRKWIEDKDHIANELSELGMSDPYIMKLKGIGEVEKEVGKDQIGHLTVMTTPKVTIALETDKRPAVETRQQTSEKALSMLDGLSDPINEEIENGKSKKSKEGKKSSNKGSGEVTISKEKDRGVSDKNSGGEDSLSFLA